MAEAETVTLSEVEAISTAPSPAVTEPPSPSRKPFSPVHSGVLSAGSGGRESPPFRCASVTLAFCPLPLWKSRIRSCVELPASTMPATIDFSAKTACA